MLQDLFPRDHRRYEGSRFWGELEALADWLAAQGHLRHPLRLHLYRVRKVLDGCDRFQPGGMFKEEDLRQAFIVSVPSAYEYLCTGRIFTRFLAAAGRLVPVERTDALSLLRCRYRHFLAEVRGLSQQSLKQHGTTVADFLSRGLSPDRGLSGLTAADVEDLRPDQEPGEQSPVAPAHCRAVAGVPALLRGPWRSAGRPGRHRYAAGLSGRIATTSTGLETVRRLLASIWRRSPRDWRDYTVLHLMAYYGLRPSEVAALRLDAVDWEAGTLRVDQRKTRSILILPLAARTLCLLRRYLQVGRADSDLPQLYLRIRSPIRAIDHYGIIDIFNYRAARSGLPLDSASSYSLRHAFAMRLLRRGVGIKVIGDLLGHRSLEATCVYRRVDIDMLRTVGLPVPGIASVKGGNHA